MSNLSLHGILPVFQTPFHHDDSIDWATLETELNWLLNAGAHGVVMAMVSEVLRLDQTERREMATRVVQYVGNRGTVIISVGAESSRMAEENARHAESVGASGLMAIPPISIAVSESELIKYYERIVRSCSLPVVVQDASGYVGRPMSIPMQAALLEEFGPERIYYKPEATPIGPRLSNLRDETKGEAKIFEGTGGIALVDSFRRGIVGTMPGADLIHAIVALWKALCAGDEQRAYALSLPISSLIAIQNSLDAFLAIEKHLLVRQGVFKNTIVRGPVGYQLDEETKEEVDRLFDLCMAAVG